MAVISTSQVETVPTTSRGPGHAPTMPWSVREFDRSLEWLYIVLVVTMTEPYIELREYDQAACTGTLLCPYLVLTTATCLGVNTHKDMNPGRVLVYERTGNILKALKIYIHPDYKRKGTDLAIVVTEPSNQTVFPTLPRAKYDFKRNIQDCIMGGYGSLKNLIVENFSWAKLKKNETDAEVVNCKKDQKHVICVHFKDLTPCPGDVGSPIVCGNALQAVYTPRNEFKRCVDRYDVTFTVTFFQVDFIERVMAVPTTNLEWLSNPLYILLLCAVTLAVIGGVYKAILRWLEHTIHLIDDEPGSAPAASELKEMISDTSCVSVTSLQPQLLRRSYLFKSQKHSKQDEVVS